MVIPGMVSIPKSTYLALRKDSNLLEALRQAGVDSWDWYDEARKQAHQWDEEDEREGV